MIVKRPNGYHVMSHSKTKSGRRKHLGGPYESKKQANERLSQIHAHKNKPRTAVRG